MNGTAHIHTLHKNMRIGEEEYLNFITFICILQTFGKQMKETATMEQCFFPRETLQRSNSLMYFTGLQRRTRERERKDAKKSKEKFTSENGVKEGKIQCVYGNREYL